MIFRGIEILTDALPHKDSPILTFEAGSSADFPLNKIFIVIIVSLETQKRIQISWSVNWLMRALTFTY